MIVDKSVEYNALCLAQYEYAMCPNDVIRVCLPCEHNSSLNFNRTYVGATSTPFFVHDSYVGLG